MGHAREKWDECEGELGLLYVIIWEVGAYITFKFTYEFAIFIINFAINRQALDRIAIGIS